jgi:hypothetical protein
LAWFKLLTIQKQGAQNNMKWLEIISLRTSVPFEHKARKYMKQFCEIIKEQKEMSADFYVHESNPGDFAIIISSQTKDGKVGGTELGSYMTEALKQFGLVDYNCWLGADDK